MKKKIIYGLVFILSVFLAKGQDRQTFNVEKLLPKSDGSIIYPKFKDFSGAEQINQHLKRYMEHMFDLDTNYALDLETAIFKGLDSLSYYICDTDSTISVKIAIVCRKGKLKSGWSDYFTFLKETGKPLFLEDIFPNQDYSSVLNMILVKQGNHISTLWHDLVKDYEQGMIPKHKYEVLKVIISHCIFSLHDAEDNFLLTNECVILHNGLFLPYELSVYVPEFFRVNR